VGTKDIRPTFDLRFIDVRLWDGGGTESSRGKHEGNPEEKKLDEL